MAFEIGLGPRDVRFGLLLAKLLKAGDSFPAQTTSDELTAIVVAMCLPVAHRVSIILVE
jgi:hypothetical protein